MHWKDVLIGSGDHLYQLLGASGRSVNLSSLKQESQSSFCRQILVFAAHPDDESIGCGLAIHTLAQQGYAVHVIFTTNGRGPRRLHRPATIRHLIRDRFDEAHKALTLLKVPIENIHCLGYPDAGLYRNTHRALRDVVRIIRVVHPQFILTHGVEGGHIDHDVTSLLVQYAALRVSGPTPVIEWAEYNDEYALGSPYPVLFPAFCEGVNPSYAMDTHLAPSVKQQALKQYVGQKEPHLVMKQGERFRLADMVATQIFIDHFYSQATAKGARYGPVLKRFLRRIPTSLERHHDISATALSWLSRVLPVKPSDLN